jgi:hypothetical protein
MIETVRHCEPLKGGAAISFRRALGHEIASQCSQ